MATFTGTKQDFHHFIGPRIRNAVNSLTRKERLKRGGICEFCGKKATLESAHVHGKGRREIIEAVLTHHTVDGVIRVPDLEALEKEILEAHLPLSNTFRFLCKPCHHRYDSGSPAIVSAHHPADKGDSVTIGSFEFPLVRDMGAPNPTKAYFMGIMPNLLKVLPKAEVGRLLDSEFCRAELSTRYSVITDDASRLFDANGRRRYYPEKVNGRYYVCNDWYDEKGRNNLAKWREYLIGLGAGQ